MNALVQIITAASPFYLFCNKLICFLVNGTYSISSYLLSDWMFGNRYTEVNSSPGFGFKLRISQIRFRAALHES